MKEVSGPVVAIALRLSSVFLPIGLMGGIQGSLNKQFAFTIAISVLLSAFNALTLSPALAALLLRPRKNSKGLLARFFGTFNGLFERATHGYVNVSHALIRKSVIAVLILAGFAVATGLLGYRLPTSFLPTEDYGYMYLNVQLPPAASMNRTDQALKNVQTILSTTLWITAFTSQFNSTVPQMYAQVDRDKVLKQGVPISDVYQTLQAYLGGL